MLAFDLWSNRYEVNINVHDKLTTFDSINIRIEILINLVHDVIKIQRFVDH